MIRVWRYRLLKKFIAFMQIDEKEIYDLMLILNTNKIQEKICAEILYKPVFNSYKIVGLIFPKF